MSWYNGNATNGFIDATQDNLQQNVDLTAIQTQVDENTNTITEHTTTLTAHNADLDNLFSTFQFRVFNSTTGAFEAKIISPLDIVIMKAGTEPKIKIVNGKLLLYYEFNFANAPTIGSGFIDIVDEYSATKFAIDGIATNLIAIDFALTAVATSVTTLTNGLAITDARVLTLTTSSEAQLFQIEALEVELGAIEVRVDQLEIEALRNSGYTEEFVQDVMNTSMEEVRVQFNANAVAWSAIVQAPSVAGATAVGTIATVASQVAVVSVEVANSYLSFILLGLGIASGTLVLITKIYELITEKRLNDLEATLLLLYEKLDKLPEANTPKCIHKNGLVIDPATNNNLGISIFYTITLSNGGKLKIGFSFPSDVKTAVIEEVIEVGNSTFVVGDIISIPKSQLGGTTGNLLINITSLISEKQVIIEQLLVIQEKRGALSNSRRVRDGIPNRSEFGNTFNIVNTSTITNPDSGEVLNVPTINVNTATTSSLGLVQVGAGINVNEGIISVNTVSTATTSSLGVVQVGGGIDVNEGIISVNSATTSKWTADGNGGISFVGNVGIGNTNPTTRLDIATTSGNCRTRLMCPDGSNSIISLREVSDLFGFDIVNEGTANHLFINGFENSATARTDLCISRANGNVGIGTNTTSTTFKLLVNGLTSSQNLTLTGTNGALHWGTFNSATLIGRVGGNNIFSTGSLIDDIVIKSGTNRVHLQSGNATPALTILTNNNVNITNALLVGTTTSSTGFIADFDGSVSLAQQVHSTLRFGDAGGISWNAGTGALYRAGTNGEISTSSVTGDIILRSDPTTRLLLQSGDSNAGVIIDTNNSVFVRNRIRFDGKTTLDVGAQFPCNKLDLFNSTQSMGFGAASTTVLEYYTPKQHSFATGTNGLLGDYGTTRMLIDHDSLSVIIYERLFMGTGRWHGSAIDFKERFYFDSDGTTYIRGHGEETVAFVVQNLNSEAKLIVNHNGVIQQDGSGAGYIARGDGFDIRLSSTSNGANIQIGNANSGRGDYAFIGTVGTESGVTFGGQLLIESGYSRDIVFNTWSSFTPTGQNYQWLFGNITGNTRRANALATWDTTSDHRLKQNIIKANLNTCYDNIKNLNLYKYNYIDGYKSGADTNRLGFIAQDVKKQFPKSVSKEKVVLNDNREIPDALTINIDQIQMSLYGTVKQLIKIVESQNIRIKKLEDMLNIVDDTIINDDAGQPYCRENCDGLCNIDNILPSPVRTCETMKCTNDVKEIVNQNLPNPQKL